MKGFKKIALSYSYQKKKVGKRGVYTLILGRIAMIIVAIESLMANKM